MRKIHPNGWKSKPATAPVTFREIYDVIQKNTDFSQGELYLLRHAIEKKLVIGTFRFDVEDLDVKPYYRAF
jgi:hypothetical protein